jgi:hypothetical protein
VFVRVFSAIATNEIPIQFKDFAPTGNTFRCGADGDAYRIVLIQASLQAEFPRPLNPIGPCMSMEFGAREKRESQWLGSGLTRSDRSSNKSKALPSGKSRGTRRMARPNGSGKHSIADGIEDA